MSSRLSGRPIGVWLVVAVGAYVFGFEAYSYLSTVVSFRSQSLASLITVTETLRAVQALLGLAAVVSLFLSSRMLTHLVAGYVAIAIAVTLILMAKHQNSVLARPLFETIPGVWLAFVIFAYGARMRVERVSNAVDQGRASFKQLALALLWLGVVAPLVGLLLIGLRFGNVIIFVGTPVFWWWLFVGSIIAAVIMDPLIANARSYWRAFGHGVTYVVVANLVHAHIPHIQGARAFDSFGAGGFLALNVMLLIGIPYIWGGVSGMLYRKWAWQLDKG